MEQPSCQVPECARPVSCRGYCDPHYRKLRRYGDPLAGKTHQKLSGTPVERLWARVDRSDPDACWVYQGKGRVNGYAQIRSGERMVLAHRLAYEAEVGPIPEGMQLDHLCRTRDCVNPSHLEVVDLAENNARTRGHRYVKTHCPKGHEYTEENTAYGPRGNRSCRECKRAAWRDWYARTGRPNR